MADKQKSSFLEPFKDIPSVLKTFPKGLIKLWKEPVNNSEEVAVRTKELKAWLYFFVPFTLVMSFLGMIEAISAITSVFMTIGFIGIIYCGFLIMVAKKAAKKFADIECDNCKTRMNTASMVDYKILDKSYRVSRQIQDRGNGTVNVIVSGTERVKVEINCKCRNCGTEKTFTQEFRTVVCERRQLGVGALNADMIASGFEKDVREEQKNGFDGSTGATITGNKDVKFHIVGYFGNTIQMG